MVRAEHFEEEKAVGGEEENNDKYISVLSAEVILFAHHRIGEGCVRNLNSKPFALKTSINLAELQVL